jgi:translation initiation factor IF-2
MVMEGTIKRSSQMRLLRDGQVIWKGTMQSLKRVKEDVREASKGYECGIVLPNNNDIKVGDIFQAYEITYLDQEL